MCVKTNVGKKNVERVARLDACEPLLLRALYKRAVVLLQAWVGLVSLPK